MRRIHAAWPTWALLAGLVFAFFGERVFASTSQARTAFDLLALLCLVASVAARASEYRATTDEARTVAKSLLASTVGVALALALYALIPLTLADEASGRARSVVWGLWPILLTASLFPLVATEIAVASVAFNPTYEQARLASARQRGLGLSLLLAVLFFANLLVARHDSKWELSESSGAVASDETVRATRELTKDVRAVLFWPRANEVGDTVQRYFERIAALNPKLTIERKDHALAKDLASKTGVTENGWVALIHENKSEKIRVGEQARSARSALRRFDRSVLKALLTVTTKKRVAYLSTGHEERADRNRDKDDRRSPVTLIRKQLETWQFDVKPLGVADGLLEAVPEDASVVLILGPEKPFLPSEQDALRRALERGVRLLVALEPEGDEQLGDLLQDLGLEFDRTPLANAQSNAPLTRTEADRAFIWSNRYSSHPSVTTMARNNRLVTVFGSAGSLTKLKAGPRLTKAKTDVVLTAVDGTFRDQDGDLEPDAEEETSSFGLAAATTRTSTSGKGNETRAFVIGDVDVFADKLVTAVQGNLMFFRDVIYWLQVDEEPIVPTVSEKDVRIVHKSDEDALLFYGTTFGAPLLVLAVGFLATGAIRRRRNS